MKRYNFTENQLYNISELRNIGVDNSTLLLLEKEKLIEKSGDSIKFVFIGSYYKKNDHFLVHPKYRNGSSCFFTTKETEIFHNCLLKFSNSIAAPLEEEDSHYKDIFFVVQDYCINGLLNSYHRISKNDWSNPSWERIFNQTPKIINTNLYWDNPISSSFTLSSQDIKKVHILSINFLLSQYPILKTFFTFLSSLPNFSAPSKEDLCFEIQKELNKTNLIREKRVLTSMYNIIKNQNLHNKGLLIGTKNPHFFFEQLCKRYTNDCSYMWSRYFPKATWLIKGNENKTSSHRPDIIFENNGKVYLYDAKYYDTNIHQPGIQDISKQILYKKCIQKIKGNSIIHNGFIFPSKNPEDHFSLETGEVRYDIFGEDEVIKVHHQYDIELFKNF
ncbi:LlaJI family restriction endonuclease [Bacillus mexicanus]|uniref:LlaJI family restriction endonuclease n=1 Tax=Bacillus mexicanus TaxID=2834415 RepID=UPI003D1C042C